MPLAQATWAVSASRSPAPTPNILDLALPYRCPPAARGLLPSLPGRYPVRWARPSTLADCASSKLPAGVVSGGGGGMRPSAQGPGSASGVPHRPLLAQLPMSSCACAVKVADLGPSSLGSAEGCLNAGAAYRPPTATGVLRDIMRKVGRVKGMSASPFAVAG